MARVTNTYGVRIAKQYNRSSKYKLTKMAHRSKAQVFKRFLSNNVTALNNGEKLRGS